MIKYVPAKLKNITSQNMIRFSFFMLPSASTSQFWSGKKANFFPSWKWLIFQMLQNLYVSGSYNLGFCCVLLGISSDKALLTYLALDSENPHDLKQLELRTIIVLSMTKTHLYFSVLLLKVNTLIKWKMWAL